MTTFSCLTATEIVVLLRRRTDDGEYSVSFASAVDLVEVFGRCEAAAAQLDAINEAHADAVKAIGRAFDKARA